MALRTGLLPATLNLEEPDEAAAAFDLVAKTARAKDVAYALVNAFGFGGVNASLLVSRAPA
jgi:3-oxoacyl-[acyl-carrier-protein] synthase II